MTNTPQNNKRQNQQRQREKKVFYYFFLSSIRFSSLSTCYFHKIAHEKKKKQNIPFETTQTVIIMEMILRKIQTNRYAEQYNICVALVMNILFSCASPWFVGLFWWFGHSVNDLVFFFFLKITRYRNGLNILPIWMNLIFVCH